jgi:hypothetical protein
MMSNEKHWGLFADVDEFEAQEFSGEPRPFLGDDDSACALVLVSEWSAPTITEAEAQEYMRSGEILPPSGGGEPE